MRKWIIYSVILIALFGADILSKQWALTHLARLEDGEAFLFLGFIPFTLTFNDGGGFSLSFGDASRWIFSAIAIVIFIALFVYLMRLREALWLRVIAISMISAGAVGNLFDRLRWDLGVVDFIGPINLGFMLWPIFNVADMAVSIGGAILVLSLWIEGTEEGKEHEEIQPATSEDEEVQSEEVALEES